MNIIDACIGLFLLAGIIIGFKQGGLKSIVTFLGTIVIFIVAYSLKNIVSVYLYTYLPFFSFSGALKGVSVLNIIIYEVMAFFIIFTILSIIFRIVLKITGIIEKVLKMTIILAIPSKIIGAIFGFCEAFIYLFVVLFIMVQFSYTAPLVKESEYANDILTRTPVLGPKVSGLYNSLSEIYSLKTKYQNGGKNFNREALKIVLKYQIITPDNAQLLVNNNKLKINNAKVLIDNYR